MHITKRLLVETVAPGRHIIFNPLSGSVDIAGDADIALLEQLRRGQTDQLAGAEEQQLRARRYLFDSPADEEAFLEKSVEDSWARMQAAQPEVYTVCPTLACNLACGYCFEGDSLTDKKQGVMTDAQVALMFDGIDSIRKGFTEAGQESPYMPLIALFGGEPLLPSTRRAVSQILERAFDGGFMVSATTNGVNLCRFSDLLMEYRNILSGFQVTLDGPKAVHDSRRYRLGGQGTFDEIVRGIDLLATLNVSIDLRVNLDLSNIDSLPELADFIHEKGWDELPHFRFALAPITQHGVTGCQSQEVQMMTELDMAQRIIAMMEENPVMEKCIHLGFLRHLEHLVGVLEPEKFYKNGARPTVGPRYWYCEASTDKQFVFTPEGYIYNCTEAVGHPTHAVGRFDPALELWQKERGQWVGRTILSHPKCRACEISTLCGGGCHMAARERNTAEQGNLLQISIGRPKGNVVAASAGNGGNRSALDPFCGAAEETVRSYLRYVGCRIGK